MQRQGWGGESAPIGFRAAGGLLLVAHLLLVGWVTLRPLDVPWVSATNLHPLAGIRADLARGPAEAAGRIGSGMLLLAPLGILLPLADGRLHVSPVGSLLRTVSAASLISLTIELLQTGVPGRVVDVDSVLLNTAGVALLHLAVVPAARARLRRPPAGPGRPAPGARGGAGRSEARRPGAGSPEVLRRWDEGRAQGATPTISRVGIAP
ncbi:VanZ family protein [Streptomyces sp. NPDC058372]|uniref:VanZ family protein n=1 Tax=Streptomyces sp. NPDC058372 TaxID=3346464 RepID=UPI0036694FF3